MDARDVGSESSDSFGEGHTYSRRLWRFLRLLAVGTFVVTVSYFIMTSFVLTPGLLVASFAMAALTIAIVTAAKLAHSGKVTPAVLITSYSLLAVVVVVAPFTAFEYATLALTCAFAATVPIAFGEPRQARPVILWSLGVALYALVLGTWLGATTDVPSWARHFILLLTVLVLVYMISHAMLQLRDRLTAMLRAKEDATRQLEATRRRLEEENARARVNDRRKDDFLAMLGHELRNPLSPITLAVEVMRETCGDIAERERAIIERQARYMTRLVDDLLDASRIKRGKLSLERQSVDLGAIVRQAAEMTRSLFAQRNQTLEIDVPERELVVDADPTRLAQVVANLLTNASRYTPEKGRAWVRARSIDGEVSVVVEDDGLGMTPALLARIFEPFVQGHEGPNHRPAGLGLGLALAKSLVELHGGSIEAASDGPGRGSRFTVTLPLADAPRIVHAPVEEHREHGAVTRVLVVDDNEDAADLLASALSRRGFEVRVAHDGRSALDIASKFDPEVAVLDIGLPEMDGYELAARIRTDAHPMKLIALTGYGQPSDHERSAKAGFSAHLVKPVDLAELERTLG